MIATKLYILLALPILMGCISHKKVGLFAKNNSVNTTITQGVYLRTFYIYKYVEKRQKEKDGNYSFVNVKTDSILIYQGYKFFTNGVARIVESQKTVTSSQM